MSLPLDTPKPALRRWARRRRRHALVARPDAPAYIAEHLRGSGLVPEGALVAGYWPLAGELDPRPAMAALGNPLALPRVAQRDAPLVFHRWSPQDELMPGAFGVREPAGSAPLADPEVILLPLLLWDDAGNRLGYGGGYYDRTLEQRPDALPIGISLQDLRVDALPVEPWDRRLHAIVTEQGVTRFSR
jgi:5-formyltetrahydrofolate cyclo-ligase